MRSSKDMAEQTLVNSVNAFRLKAGWTQEELGEKVGVTRQTIIAMEKGNYTPSVLLALNLAKVFKQPVEKIFYSLVERAK